MAHATFYEYYWEYWNLYHKVTFDGPNKTIIINDGVTNLSVQRDIYSAWKEWKALDSIVNSKYPEAIRTIGGDRIDNIRTAGDLYFLRNGWKIQVPPGLVNIEGAIFNDENIPVFDILPGGGVTSVVSQLVQTVEGGGGSSSPTLTQQQIRDAMTLPASVPPQSGSIDDKLDSSGTTLDVLENDISVLDGKVSSQILVLNSIQTNIGILGIRLDDVTILIETLLKYQSNRTRVDEATKTLTVYDDDGVTPLRIFNLLDQNGDPSAECIFERVPQ